MIFIVAIIAVLFIVWHTFLIPLRTGAEGTSVFISKGAGIEDVKDVLRKNGLLVNETAFDLLADRKNYENNIRPGHYLIPDGMSYNEMMNVLRSGNQTPVKIVFNNIRTLPELAGRLGQQFEADSVQILDFLLTPGNYSNDGFTPETIMAVFLPDTYEMYWTATPGEIYRRMLKEFRNYWNGTRLAKANSEGLTPVEVSTLASIVDDEVMMEEEKPAIAGVYLNRLKRNMPLQACPTIKFALNDFTIRRVLNEYLKVDSPYNTYTHTGLPPGPVRCATKSGIDAVLDAERHNYLYFVAKDDFSGYHHFSTTLREHNEYAARYQAELDRRKIYH